jgi:hypothetical protein
MLEEGHDGAELRQGILEHVRYMRMMYMLSKKVFVSSTGCVVRAPLTKLQEDAAEVGVKVPYGILDMDADDEESD